MACTLASYLSPNLLTLKSLFAHHYGGATSDPNSPESQLAALACVVRQKHHTYCIHGIFKTAAKTLFAASL